ncbi:tape measure protein [Leuconostoc citreum]|uniref:tape measure protein n=1 Tax=Leuconostoc citreum TaxID=33964 RepID=UPI00200AC6A3|nr:tape measure protein [Leuconostoc citreum]MCK8606168.1 tape measure protein [Leuconostoc citreum]
MADKQIIKTVATQMTLDTSSAKESLRDLTSSVKDSVSEAKILEAQYRASGDTVNASKAKYEGLQQTLDLQKTKVDAIKTALEQNNAETKKGQEVQTLLQNQLAGAERQYASYQGQLDKATQSYKYQESGLADLTKELKHNQDMTDARVRSLQAEGREDEAKKVKLEGLKTATENLTKQYEIQKTELNQLGEAGDKSSDAYKRQALRVEQMGAKLAESKRDIKSFNDTAIKPEIKGTAEVKSKLTDLDNSLEGTRNTFKKFLGANLIAAGINNAFSSVKSHITGVFQAGVEYNKQIEGMRIGLDNFTNGNKELSGQFADIIQKNHEASGYSLGTLSALSKKTYGFMGKNLDKTKEVVQSFTQMGRATGQSDESMQALIGTFGKVAAGGDVSAASLVKVNKQLPGFSNAVAKHMGISADKMNELAKAGKLSMEDLMNGVNQIASDKGTRGLENYNKSFEGFTQHFSERYKSLSGKITESFFSANNAALGSLSKVLDGPDVDKAFTRIGDSASKAMGAVTKAFSGVFGGSKTNPVADMANWTADAIEKLGNFVAKHAEDIKSFFTMVKDLGSVAFGTLKSTLKIVIPMLEGVGKFAKEHPTTFKVLAGAVIGFDLALKGTLGTIKLFGQAKSAFNGVKAGIASVGSAAKKLKNSKAFSYAASMSTKAATKGLEALKVAGKSTGAALKTAFNFAKSNPLILIATVITTVIVALVELYKHNKKFKAFLDGLAKAASGFFKGIGKWITQAWNNAKKVFSKVVSFFKKDWKEILLLIVNPFSGAFALLYKHNDKFRKSVNNLIKSVINIVKGMGKTIGDTFNAIVKFITDCWNSITKTTRNVWNSIGKFFSDTLNSIWKTLVNTFNSIVKFIADTLNTIWNNWVNIFKNIGKFFGDTWDWLKKTGSNSINAIHDTISGVLDKIVGVFKGAWKSVKDGFSDLWDGMKKLAADGINMVINPINSGIGGINDIIHDFGGPKNTIGKIDKVKFADGTGAFSGERKPITKPTLALLNDGVDSPETGNKEALVHPNGQMEIVQGNNVNRWLAPGTEVLNAKELAMLMGATPFAKGTGFLGSIWDGLKGAGSWVGKVAGNAWDGMKDGAEKFTKMLGYITDAVAHPIESLTKKFNPKTNGGFGTLFNAFGDGAFGKATDSVKGWWSELWGMAKGSAESGDVGGQGDNYPWKSVGKDSGADPWGYFYRECVSYVANSLKNMGVSTGLFSGLGNGSDWVNAPVRHTNDPKPGMVAVYGPGSEFGNHVAMVRGVKGSTFSGEEYNWGGDGNYHTYSGRSKSGVTTFLDFGKSGGGEEGVEANNPLQKLIKGQVGGMFNWIQKFIGPVNDTSTGVGGDVQSWSNDVKNALAKLGLSTAPDMIQRVLRQIQTESGGNPKAMGGNDGLADGNATGLMQVKPGTFAANMLPGHGNIMNGYDNILAGLNYARKRYGDGLSFLGNGHGYANGGLITKHQIAEIGEGNKPEMIIPLDGMKSSRGFELLGKTAVAMAARDGHQTSMNSASEVSVLEDKFDKMINLLSQLVQGQADPIPAVVSANQANAQLNKLKSRNNSIDILTKG